MNLSYLSNRKRFPVFSKPDINTRGVGGGGGGDSRQLCKPETKSRVCITVKNANPSS